MNLEKYKRLSIKWNIAVTKFIAAYHEQLNLGLITNTEFLTRMAKIASRNLMMNSYIRLWSAEK